MNGNILMNLRMNNGLLQKELAQNLGISVSAIGMYEHNRRQPDHDTLKKIANYFNVSIDYLLENKSTSENEDIENLRLILIKHDILNEDEYLSKELFNALIEFIRINKEFWFLSKTNLEKVDKNYKFSDLMEKLKEKNIDVDLYFNIIKNYDTIEKIARIFNEEKKDKNIRNEN